MSPRYPRRSKFICDDGHEFTIDETMNPCGEIPLDKYKAVVADISNRFDRMKDHRNKQLENRNMITPEEFNKLGSGEKWQTWKSLIGIQWICGECVCDQDEPERMFPEGSRHCSNCDNELTRRTGGGQSDPFEYSFKYKIQEQRDIKLKELGI